jgi:hypothetical protein
MTKYWFYIIKPNNYNKYGDKWSYNYVGKTTNFKGRISNHKNDCNSPNNKRYNYNVYKCIREGGGWDNWSVEILEEGNFENKYDADRRERYYIEYCGGDLNILIPTRTKQEFKETHKEELQEYFKKYREEHKDEQHIKRKKIYEKNKEEILKQHKERYEQNKEEILKKCKEYAEKNKEKVKKNQKEYAEKNKEKLKKYQEEYRKNHKK